MGSKKEGKTEDEQKRVSRREESAIEEGYEGDLPKDCTL